jgi:predicted dehydrogenase
MIVMAKTVRFGVIGMGRMGLWHAKNLRFRVSGAKLVAIADLDKASAKRGSLETGVPSFGDYRELLGLKELDAVCVVTTTDTHAPIATEAAELGLNVFVEKPMAITTKQADRLESTVKRRGVKLQVGFMRRFDPAYARAEQHVLKGDIGKPIVFKSTSRDPFPPPAWACDPKHGGGLQIEMHAHDYDLARWFMKSEVSTVFTKAECLVFPQLKKSVPEFVDNTLITLGFANRSIGLVEGSLNARYGYDVRTEIYGTDGMITVGNIQRAPLVVYTPAGGNAETSFLGDKEAPHFAQRFDMAYLTEMRHFVNTIRSDLRATPSLREGRAALDIGLAAFESTEKKKQVEVVRS